MTINNLNSKYSQPRGSLEIPKVNTSSGEKSIRNICSILWNKFFRELSIENITEYNKCELWLQNTKIHTLKHMLKQNFIQKY